MLIEIYSSRSLIAFLSTLEKRHGALMTQLALDSCVFLWAHSLLSANLSCVQHGHVDNVTLHLWYIRDPEVFHLFPVLWKLRDWPWFPIAWSHLGHYWHCSFESEGFVAVGGFLPIINGPTCLNCACSQFKWLAKLLCPPPLPMVALFQAKPIYGGWLCLAPEGTDFDNPMQRSRVRTCTTDLDVCSLNVYIHMHTR